LGFLLLLLLVFILSGVFLVVVVVAEQLAIAIIVLELFNEYILIGHLLVRAAEDEVVELAPAERHAELIVGDAEAFVPDVHVINPRFHRDSLVVNVELHVPAVVDVYSVLVYADNLAAVLEIQRV